MTAKEKRNYRISLGFTSQEVLKKYFKAKDVYSVNWSLIEIYNQRIIDIFEKINAVMFEAYQLNEEEFAAFSSKITSAYQVLKETEIIQTKFHNQGRSSEDVYFNWMRGYAVNNFFLKVIARIFEVDDNDIEQLGKDNIEQLITTRDPSVFNRKAVADLKISSKNIYVEVLAGFTGQNDIKETKAHEAKTRHAENGWSTFVIHFDLFTGCVAIVNITSLLDNLSDDAWIRNPRFETTVTTAIKPNCFTWRIVHALPEDPKTLYSIIA